MTLIMPKNLPAHIFSLCSFMASDYVCLPHRCGLGVDICYECSSLFGNFAVWFLCIPTTIGTAFNGFSIECSILGRLHIALSNEIILHIVIVARICLNVRSPLDPFVYLSYLFARSQFSERIIALHSGFMWKFPSFLCSLRSLPCLLFTHTHF